jgi:hypothetical protein
VRGDDEVGGAIVDAELGSFEGDLDADAGVTVVGQSGQPGRGGGVQLAEAEWVNFQTALTGLFAVVVAVVGEACRRGDDIPDLDHLTIGRVL